MALCPPHPPPPDDKLLTEVVDLNIVKKKLVVGVTNPISLLHILSKVYFYMNNQLWYLMTEGHYICISQKAVKLHIKMGFLIRKQIYDRFQEDNTLYILLEIIINFLSIEIITYVC